MITINPSSVAVASDVEWQLEHRCRMGLLAVAVLHWIVFYLLTQSGAAPVSGSDNFTRVRKLNAQHTVQMVDARSPLL